MHFKRNYCIVCVCVCARARDPSRDHAAIARTVFGGDTRLVVAEFERAAKRLGFRVLKSFKEF